MGDFVNYTPGEYAKEHIRITPTTLADGRDFFYLDDDPEYVSGVKTRELKDPRQLPYRFSNQLNAAGEEVPYAAPEMRRDPLTGDWIPMATARMNRLQRGRVREPFPVDGACAGPFRRRGIRQR